LRPSSNHGLSIILARPPSTRTEPVLTPLLACLIVLLALGAAERLARDRAIRAVPIRVHVNGTRAKSTVTRLIWSALVEAGVPTIAKTTGTAARILLPDRREIPVTRRGPANIREQLALLRLARRSGARAVVVECMALDPFLQRVTEREMIRATIGVITNVRLDHTEVMGPNRTAIAAALANTVPSGGVLVTGPAPCAPPIRRRADALGTRVVEADADAGRDNTPGGERWVGEDVALALAVTRELGIDDRVARRGFATAPRDPGAMRQGHATLRGGEIHWLDATAANDPESLDLLLDEFGPWQDAIDERDAGRARIVVYHHRDDRAPRLDCFADCSRAFAAADHLVVSGARPPLSVWRRLAQKRPASGLAFVAVADMPRWLAARASATVVFCGNTRGLSVPRVLEEAATCD
jgi:poly-gamma-glutamate synthase PgsB/CapB